MDQVILSIILSVLSNEIFSKKEGAIKYLKEKRFERELSEAILQYINSHDGTILTSGDFASFLENSNPIGKINEHIKSAENHLSKEKLIEGLLNSFVESYMSGKNISPLGRADLQSFFQICYSSIEKYHRSFLTDNEKFMLSQYNHGLARSEEQAKNNDNKILDKIDTLTELLLQNGQIPDTEIVRKAYFAIVESLLNGESVAITALLPVIKGKNNDLELCTEYLIGLLSDQVAKVTFSDIQSKVEDEVLYEDVARITIYMDMIFNRLDGLIEINDRCPELLAFVESLRNKEYDGFYTISRVIKDGREYCQYTINQEKFPSQLWLLKRVCFLKIIDSMVANAADVSVEILNNEMTLVDSILISERKTFELLNSISNSVVEAEQLLQRLIDELKVINHLSNNLQCRYYSTLLRLSGLISLEKSEEIRSSLPSGVLEDLDIQMLCMQIDLERGHADIGKIIDLCNRKNQYWLLNNYCVQKYANNPEEIKTLLTEHRYLLKKSVVVFQIYDQVICQQEGVAAASCLLTQFEDIYKNSLEYWVQRIRISSLEGDMDYEIIENTIRALKKEELVAVSYGSVIQFVQILSEAGKYPEALSLINDIENTMPLTPSLLRIKGYALNNVGCELEALKCFMTLFDNNDKDELAAENIITICINNNREVPVEVLQLAMKSQRSRMLMLAAICSFRHGRHEEAFILIRNALLRNTGDNDCVYQKYIGFCTNDASWHDQEATKVDGNTAVTLISPDGEMRTICVYKDHILPHDHYMWGEAEHIYLETAAVTGLLWKTVDDKVLFDGEEYTITNIKALNSYFFIICMNRLVSSGMAKTIYIPEEDMDCPEKIMEILKTAMGMGKENSLWLDQYKDFATLPLPFYSIRKYSRFPYFQLIRVFLEDSTIVFRELFNPGVIHKGEFVLSSAALVALYQIGFAREDTEASIIVPEALYQAVIDETNNNIDRNNRESVASLIVREDRLFFIEASDEEKLKLMSDSAGLKQFCSQFQTVRNACDLQFPGSDKIDYKELMGVSDYDALALAKHEGKVLVTAEPTVAAIAGIVDGSISTIGIADFLAEAKIPTLKLLSCIEKMLSYRFLLPFTENVLLSLIASYNSMEDEEEKVGLITKWAELLELPLADLPYASLISSLMWELYIKVSRITDEKNPILITFLTNSLKYREIKYSVRLGDDGELKIYARNVYQLDQSHGADKPED